MRIKSAGRTTRPKPRSQVVGLSDSLSAALDALIARQPDPKPSRPEMIRRVLAKRLAEEGLDVAEPDQVRSADGGAGLRRP